MYKDQTHNSLFRLLYIASLYVITALFDIINSINSSIHFNMKKDGKLGKLRAACWKSGASN